MMVVLVQHCQSNTFNGAALLSSDVGKTTKRAGQPMLLLL